MGPHRRLMVKSPETTLLGRLGYRLKGGADVFDDEFAAVCARWKKCVFSHGSALYLLGLSDRPPFSLDVTVPHGYNPKSLKDENPRIRIHRVSPRLHALGVVDIKMPMGNPVRCYDAERSIADLIKERARGGVDTQLMRDAYRWLLQGKRA